MIQSSHRPTQTHKPTCTTAQQDAFYDWTKPKRNPIPTQLPECIILLGFSLTNTCVVQYTPT